MVAHNFYDVFWKVQLNVWMKYGFDLVSPHNLGHHLKTNPTGASDTGYDSSHRMHGTCHGGHVLDNNLPL